jgi:class 3 adenylate cyclase
MGAVPLYMDIHLLPDATPEELEEAHRADQAVECKYGVRHLKYWHNRPAGKVFCLVEAPNPEAAEQVHREAHGLIADEIIEVEPWVTEAFLGGGNVLDGLAVQSDGNSDGGFRTILFTDMEGSTSLTNRVGDDRAMEILRSHNNVIREALREHGGREVKHTGDGIMAAFTSASKGVACAIAVQQAFAQHNAGHADHPIAVRVGLSAGEPVEDSSDLFGASVQLAARVCDRARPGQILVANVVAELCIGKGFVFQDQGPTELRGFSAPMRLHEVAWS